MNYTPHTKYDIDEMLNEIGLKNIDELFSQLPKELLLKDELELADGISEMEVSTFVQTLARKNNSFSQHPIFMGGGVYDHYIPPAVDLLSGRGEFYTAYTPYQPEASQGTLQAIIEYQTAITRLTKMDIANASLYDGSTALGEAILMSVEISNKNEVLISSTVHPEWIDVAHSYVYGKDINIKLINQNNGETSINEIKSMISPNTACVCIQSPNFFGVIEDYRELKKYLAEQDVLLVVAVYPFSLGFINPPGEWDADIVIGDGQSLGNYISFGGPHFGFLVCKKDFIRKIPGRIVGETIDAFEQKGFCLTFQTREQHIRREKATSNICSNQALMALRAIIYLSLLGEDGLKEAANLAYHKAHYLQKKICELSAYELKFNKPFFNEFVIQSKIKPEIINKSLFDAGIIGGLSLNRFNNQYENQILFAVTEKRTKNEMDNLVKVLQKIS
ncbi:MAG: aminomethyl-transferring glycine dehydrogenase subunit GcvPA [Spirochaetota bacterium]|nr:aminomethyl-transferring glycine dehydrogenase subunit GcvPA [Spirochaetota bacterium]